MNVCVTESHRAWLVTFSSPACYPPQPPHHNTTHSLDATTHYQISNSHTTSDSGTLTTQEDSEVNTTAYSQYSSPGHRQSENSTINTMANTMKPFAKNRKVANTTEPSPADVMASVTQVCSTPELLECILSHLPVLNLVIATGVNKTFRNVSSFLASSTNCSRPVCCAMK